MLFPTQDSWSQADVRKVIALFASEQLRMQAICDALPVGVGLVDVEMEPLWSNKLLRSMWQNIPQSAKHSMKVGLRASLRSGAPVTTPAGPEGHATFLPSRMLTGEIIVILSREAVAGSRPSACTRTSGPTREQAHRNIAALEGCLSAAFPSQAVRQLDQAESAGALQFSIDFDGRESVLTVTEDALAGPELPIYLSDIPEALRLTRSVTLTTKGERIN